MAKPKHIAILSPINRQAGQLHGGITRVVINLANAFYHRGLKIELLMTVPPDSAVRPHDLEAGVGLINLGKLSKPVMVSKLGQYLKNTHPDVLLSAGWKYNIVAGWSKRLNKIDTNVWASIHNTLSAEQRWNSILKRWRKKLSIVLAYAPLRGIIAVSTGVAHDFARETGISMHRIRVIPNPILSETIIEQSHMTVEHPWFGRDCPPVVLGLGRLAPQKDFKTLLMAFAKVKKQVSCRLVIFGEGEQRSELEKLILQLGIQDSVEMPGFISNPYAYMRCSALFVLSSVWEGFGNVLVEALAMGVPVVSTDCPHGPREILDNGRYGKLVKVEDPDGMSQAMLEAMQAPVNRKQLQERALDFEVNRVADQYLSLMQLNP